MKEVCKPEWMHGVRVWQRPLIGCEGFTFSPAAFDVCERFPMGRKRGVSFSLTSVSPPPPPFIWAFDEMLMFKGK